MTPEQPELFEYKNKNEKMECFFGQWTVIGTTNRGDILGFLKCCNNITGL